jgi:hypothetical protein
MSNVRFWMHERSSICYMLQSTLYQKVQPTRLVCMLKGTPNVRLGITERSTKPKTVG